MADKIAVLWDEEVAWNRENPFGKKEINSTYGYLADLAKEEDLSIYIGKYQWYSEGKMTKAWVFEDEWRKVENVVVNGVYDKFHYGPETIPLKQEISEKVGLLNHPEVEELCKDKLLTYERFSEWVPETREASQKNIGEMLEKHGKAVLKPRFAFGGEGIYIINSLDEIPSLEEDYIVQKFIDSSKGVEGLAEGYHDLRAIVVNGKLLSSYIRYNEDSEISNVQQGGTKEVVSLSEFPESAREIVNQIEKQIEHKPVIFSIDFFFDENNKPWVVELNSKPGMTIYNQKMKEEITPVMKELLEAFKKL